MADMTFTLPDGILPLMKDLGVDQYGLDPNCDDPTFQEFLRQQFVAYTRSVVTEYQLRKQILAAQAQATTDVHSNISTIFGDPAPAPAPATTTTTTTTTTP